LLQFLDFARDDICSHQTRSLGSKYNKNAFVTEPFSSKRIFGVFRAHGMCLVAANVVLSLPLRDDNNSAPLNPLVGFEGPLLGREREGKVGGKFLVTASRLAA